MLVTALDARVRLGTHEGHRITFANMAFTDDPGVQPQAAAESAANIAKDLGIALERIGIKSIEGLSGMREYGTAVPGSEALSTGFRRQKTRRGLKCYVNQRSGLIPSTVVGINFPSIQTWKTASEKYSRQVAGQARRAIFDIVADDFYAVYSQKNTALFTHAPRCRGVGYTERCL